MFLYVVESSRNWSTLISHQQSASKKLVEKLKHIDESYELTHGELDEGKHLEPQFH